MIYMTNRSVISTCKQTKPAGHFIHGWPYIRRSHCGLNKGNVTKVPYFYTENIKHVYTIATNKIKSGVLQCCLY